MVVDQAKIARLEKELEEARKELLREDGERYRILMREIHPPRHNPHAALKLVRSPGDDEQLALWEILKHQNLRGFMDYFMLSEATGGAVYNQWRRMFHDLRGGRELPWQEVISATENLLDVIDEAQKPQVRAAKPISVSKPVIKASSLHPTPGGVQSTSSDPYSCIRGGTTTVGYARTTCVGA